MSQNSEMESSRPFVEVTRPAKLIVNQNPVNSATDLAIKKERGPSSLRKKQSQRFTVAHHIHHPTDLAPPLPSQSYIHQRTPSISSTSDSDFNQTPPDPSSNHITAPPPPAYMSTSSTSSNGQYATVPYPGSSASPALISKANNINNNTSVSGNNNLPHPSSTITTPLTGTSMPPTSADSDEEIIPNAIVVKNIPFSVRREQLLAIIDDLMIPAPYAFNYHFDSGVFRGLAFANFRSASEADAAVAGLNGFDISGRKLRVEYKKVLQAGEKERIEKEKAIKRMRSMQLQKDGLLLESSFHSSQQSSPAQQTPASFVYHHHHQQAQDQDDAGLLRHHALFGTPTPGHPPLPARPSHPNLNYQANSFTYHNIPPSSEAQHAVATTPAKELDMNDPQTLELYSRIVVFKEDNFRDEFAFAKSLSSLQRRLVHQIAKKLGLEHRSEGFGDDRFVVVSKAKNRQTIRVKKSMPDMRRGDRGDHYYHHPAGGLGASPELLHHQQYQQQQQHRGLGERKSTLNLRQHHHTGLLRPSPELESSFNALLISHQQQQQQQQLLQGGGSASPIIRQPKGPESGASKGFAKFRFTNNGPLSTGGVGASGLGGSVVLQSQQDLVGQI